MVRILAIFLVIFVELFLILSSPATTLNGPASKPLHLALYNNIPLSRKIT